MVVSQYILCSVCNISYQNPSQKCNKKLLLNTNIQRDNQLFKNNYILIQSHKRNVLGHWMLLKQAATRSNNKQSRRTSRILEWNNFDKYLLGISCFMHLHTSWKKIFTVLFRSWTLPKGSLTEKWYKIITNIT